VSQTPELTAMADAVVDLDGMAIHGERDRREAVAAGVVGDEGKPSP
jgi:hypothetical protein